MGPGADLVYAVGVECTMTTAQWKLLLRFMFNVMYLLNRKSNTPTHEGNWEFEGELLDEIELMRENGDE